MVLTSVILLALVVFPLWFLFVAWVVISISGWPRLAERYPAELPPADLEWIRVPTVQAGRGRMPGMNFNNVVKLAFDANTVYLRQMRPFGWLAKPLRIPLSALRGERSKGLVRERLELTVAAVPEVRLRVYGRPRHLVEEAISAGSARDEFGVDG